MMDIIDGKEFVNKFKGQRIRRKHWNPEGFDVICTGHLIIQGDKLFFEAEKRGKIYYYTPTDDWEFVNSIDEYYKTPSEKRRYALEKLFLREGVHRTAYMSLDLLIDEIFLIMEDRC